MPSGLLETLIADAEALDTTELPAGALVPGVVTALAKRLEQHAPELLSGSLAPPTPTAPHGMSADQVQAQGQAGLAAGAAAGAPVVGSPTAAEDAATIANQNAEIQQLRARLASQEPPQ